MTTIEIYLWINAVLYSAFSLWCLWKPTTTATFTGLGLLNASGRSEYFALYVGLQGAWAVLFIVCAVNLDLQHAGILYAVFIYAGLVLGRWISIFQKGISSNKTYILAILEIVLGTWAAVLL